MYADSEGKAWHRLTGAYSSESIYVDIACEDSYIVETLQALLSYPSINDETVSIIENEIESSYWENCYKTDFLDAIKKKFNGWYIECSDEDTLYNLYTDLKEIANEYFVVESGGSGFIRIENLIVHLTAIPDYITNLLAELI